MGIGAALTQIKKEAESLRSDSPTDYALFKMVKSIPPSGKCRVTNIYVDPVTQKVIVDYDDTPQS